MNQPDAGQGVAQVQSDGQPVARPERPSGKRPTIDLSILIPTYNEADNIGELLRRISRVVVERKIPCEVLVLDDQSPDGTAMTAFETDVPIVVRVIERTGPRGLSPAVIDGIEQARGEYVLVMDADLQHPPESIVDLLWTVREGGADFVIGSRYVPGGDANEFGFYRKLNSKAATWLAAPLVGLQVRDPMAGFFCCRRDLIEGHELSPIGYKIALEIMVKCRPQKVAEVPIRFGSRHAGDSKMNFGQQLDYLRHLRRLYEWRWPAASQFGLFCAVGATGVVVDLTIMMLLVSGGWTFGPARVLSIMAAMLSNFLLNRRITFPGAVQGRCPGQLARFVGVCSLGMGINWVVSNACYSLMPSLRGAYQLCCLAGIAAGTVNNYLLSKYVAFRTSNGSDGRSSADGPQDQIKPNS
ncbi:MAG: glycosyltransferase family 2 protein [bacterium]|nr:glycosyltransferase family 2 protein [bacterium]